MNITEAVRTQSLLAWITDPHPEAESTDLALVDARFLADRARRALGAGPDAEQISDQIRAALAARRTAPTPEPAEDRLVRLAELLAPCPRPDIEDGWDLCAHAEPWPCVITRAAWIAAGLSAEEATW